MKHIWILGILPLLLLLACEEPIVAEPIRKQLSSKQTKHKKYGFFDDFDSKKEVPIAIGNFSTIIDLDNRMQDIACSDSLPKITFNSEDTIKTIYFSEGCRRNYICILIIEKNIIQVTKDSVFKGSDVLPIKDLFSIMDKDYHNFGNDLMYSDSPDRIGINIVYERDEKVEELIPLLDKITNAFEALNVNDPLRIYLSEKLMIKPPPPPPKT